MALQRPREVSTPASAEINSLPRWSSGKKAKRRIWRGLAGLDSTAPGG
jgi:hypothetical protein